MADKKEKKLKPFLKWAGGKTQLLHEIEKRMPFSKDESFIYIEPFVGSGAVLFWVLNNYPRVSKIIINDINTDLVNVYEQIASNVEPLIQLLEVWQKEYHQLALNEDAKKEYYYAKRKLFNQHKSDEVVQAALLVFLNRTCFNGLFRVNKSNEFNVPIGSYKTPMIADKDNLRRISEGIQQVIVRSTNFEEMLEFSDDKAFFYLDPPYKPLSNTSSFNSYSKSEFNDNEQIKLKEFCDVLHEKGCKWLLSNSDPVDEKGNYFFDDLYAGYTIERVQATRNINSKGNKRGKLNEVLIRNY